MECLALLIFGYSKHWHDKHLSPKYFFSTAFKENESTYPTRLLKSIASNSLMIPKHIEDFLKFNQEVMVYTGIKFMIKRDWIVKF